VDNPFSPRFGELVGPFVALLLVREELVPPLAINPELNAEGLGPRLLGLKAADASFP
jgi:hypothetical protein